MHRSQSTLTRAELAGGCRESLIDVFQRNGRERRRWGGGVWEHFREHGLLWKVVGEGLSRVTPHYITFGVKKSSRSLSGWELSWRERVCDAGGEGRTAEARDLKRQWRPLHHVRKVGRGSKGPCLLVAGRGSDWEHTGQLPVYRRVWKGIRGSVRLNASLFSVKWGG